MDNFPTIEEVHLMLDNIAEELPKEIFKELNEGIVLLPEYKIHPESRRDNKLYIMGEYAVSFTGRNIRIYYGSFKRAYDTATRETIYDKLRETLLHEFTHHLESLAGEKDLEIEDAEKLDRYRKSQ
ncbi:MAG: metallopeptidase family protein [Tissierellaceae bacterium]